MNSANEKICVPIQFKISRNQNKLSVITMSYAFIFLLLLCLIHNYQGVTSKQTAETCKQIAKPTTKYGLNNNVILNNQSITIATPIDQNDQNQPQKQFIIRNVTSHR